MVLSEHEEAAVRTALVAHPAGFIPKPEDLPVCERMAARNVLERVAVEGNERYGYRATDRAMVRWQNWHAIQAAQN
jgi:hypothetical protein